MLACLFKKEELTDGKAPDDAIIVDGIVNKYGFHPRRVAEKKQEIASLLAELPDSFFSDKGGGMSFLNACEDKHGELWGEHPDMGALFALGQAAELVTCPMPREFWAMLPGSVPYYTVNADKVRALQMSPVQP
jgi:hypothetical protein